MKLVYSVRSDGLGQRLCSLLYALVVCQKKGFDLRVGWQSKTGSYGKFHSVETAGEIFTPKFLDDFFTNKTYDEVSNDNSLMSISGFLNDDVELMKEGLFVDGSLVVDGFVKYNEYFNPNDVMRAFNSIDFNENINEAIKLSSRISLGKNPVAIHVRGGDIVYGPFSKHLKFQLKAVPIYILVELAKELSSKGFTPVVFLQDVADKSYFEEIENVIFSDDYFPDRLKKNSERAFYDFYLMSRCLKIYSGSSGFSRLAAMMSGSEIIDVWSVYNSSYIKDQFANAVKNHEIYNSKLILHFLSSYYMYNKARFDDVLNEDLLEFFLEKYQNKGVLGLMLLNLYLTKKDFEKADCLLKKSFSESEKSDMGSQLLFAMLKSKYRHASVHLALSREDVSSFYNYSFLHVLKLYFDCGSEFSELVANYDFSDEVVVFSKMLSEYDKKNL